MESLYRKHSKPADFVPQELFTEIVATLNYALPYDFCTDYPELATMIEKNNAVFSAFKVHDECSRMAKLLVGDDGQLRSFDDWVKKAEPIAKHHNKVWMRTEYDTAVKRAQQARDWKQFEAEADVLPNLRWVPSTAAKPGPDHSIFWDTIRPIDDPFWSAHHPGDRWGCQCSLEATDEPATAVPESNKQNDQPAPGLEGNPAKTGELFSKSHPYFPDSCASCPFSPDKTPATPTNKAQDCANCKYMQKCLPKGNEPDYVVVKRYDNGATIQRSPLVNKEDNDYPKLMQIAEHFAKMGKDVTLTPKMTRPPSFDYDCFYKSLRGTKYEGKCPDLLIGGKWYEHEGYISANPKNAFRNMLQRGLEQSDRLIIDRIDLEERYMRRRILNRVNNGADINEVWLRNADESLTMLFRKTEGQP